MDESATGSVNLFCQEDGSTQAARTALLER
jgi:hypothetical protein